MYTICFITDMKVGFGNYTPHFRGTGCLINPYRSDILKKEPLPSDMPAGLDLSDNEALANYTKAKIKGLLDFERKNSKEFDENKFINSIISKIDEGNVNSSYIEILLDMVQDKKLPSSILFLINSGRISGKVRKDLDKLYDAYINNKNVADVFVPNFKSAKDALENIGTGDVCQIEGNNNISIKMPDGSIKKLFISKDAYFKLFPPVERFIINQSSKTGDCYLLAPLDSLYNNPNTRSKILEKFRENPDGTIDVAFGGFKQDKAGRIKQKNKSETIVKDVLSKISGQNKAYNVSYTAPWVMALEIPKQIIKTKEHEAAGEYAIEFRRIIFKELLKHIKENKIHPYESDKHSEKALASGAEAGKSIYNAGEVYTKEEIELLLSFLEKGEPMIALHKASITGGEKLYDYSELKYEDLLKKLGEIEGREDDISRYERLFLERKIKHLETKDPDTRDDYIEITDCIPLCVYFDLFSTDEIPSKIIDNGGYPDAAFIEAGCETYTHVNCSYFSSNSAEDFIKRDNISNYAITASETYKSIQKKDDFSILARHVYSLEPVDINGQRKFLVRDPHNSVIEEVFTPDEILQYFDKIIVAKI